MPGTLCALSLEKKQSPVIRKLLVRYPAVKTTNLFQKCSASATCMMVSDQWK